VEDGFAIVIVSTVGIELHHKGLAMLRSTLWKGKVARWNRANRFLAPNLS
jgi:hypothetical protein